MKIIDAHTHTFPDAIAPKVIPHLQAKAQSVAFTDGTDAALQRSMEQAGICTCIQLPVMTNAAQVVKLNDLAAAKNERFESTGLFSLGGMHPDFENPEKELKRIAANGITGIKLHPAYQGMDLDDVRYVRIIDKACELSLAIVIHAGWDIGIMHHNFASVAHIQNVLRQIAPEKFVLAHMGGWKDWDEVEHALCGENVYFDTSFSLGAYEPPQGITLPKEKTAMLSREQFQRMVLKHGAEKILFGSDSPWSDQQRAVQQISSCGFSPEQEEYIFWRNAKELFGIKNQ